MTENAYENTAAAPAKSGRRLKTWLGALLALVTLPPILFFAAGALVDRTRIPAEVRELPPDLALALAPPATGTPSTAAPDTSAPPAGDGRGEFAFPAAHRTRAEDALRMTSEKGNAAYNAFLLAELREHSEQEGGRLYLELYKRFRDKEDWGKLLVFWERTRTRNGAPKLGEPLSQEQTQWLTANGDIAEAFLRFAESPGLPQRTREEIVHDPHPLEVPVADTTLLRLGCRVLGAEGRRRMEAADPTGAERFWHAALRVGAQVIGEPFYKLSGVSALNEGMSGLSAWAASGDVSTGTLTAWRTTLAEAHRVVFRRGWVAEEQEWTYPIKRQELVDECDRDSWQSYEFGWDADLTDRRAYYEFDAFGTRLPRLDHLAATALVALRNKRDAPRLLGECDEFHRETIRRARMTWPEQAAAGELVWPQANPFLNPPYGQMVQGASNWSVAVALGGETRLNLLRAAIEWRLAPPDAKPDPATMTITDRESPWRDPFAEAPLRMTALAPGGDETGGVLLYSLGSDLQDQHGQIEYDPSNGTVSAGDLTLKMDVKR